MKALALSLAALLLSACGGGSDTGSASTPAVSAPPDVSAQTPPVTPTPPVVTPPVTTPTAPTTPVVTAPAPTTPAAPTYSAYEGMWLGVSYYEPSFQAPNYPGFIIDADGYYWSESINWMETDFGFMTGQITSSTSMTVIEGGILDGSGLFADQLVVSTISTDGSVIIVTGSLTGYMSENQNTGQFSYAGGPFQTLGYYETFSHLANTTPNVAALAGSYITAWGSPLTINSDGTFTLDDNGSFASNGSSAGCTYTGTITIKDANTNVYSITGTTTAPWLNNDGATLPVTGVFTVSSEGLLQGGITDGNGSECTTTVDTVSAT